jgi:CDGSH-type Zn-finger protein
MAGGPLLVSGVPVVRLVKAAPTADGAPRWSAEVISDDPAELALCRCGSTSAAPLCDRWPDRPCFEERSAEIPSPPPFTWRPPDGYDGRPAVGLKPDGPIRVSGGAAVEREDGAVADRGHRVSLCRCGWSKVAPFCDGSHKIAGFRSP